MNISIYGTIVIIREKSQNEIYKLQDKIYARETTLI